MKQTIEKPLILSDPCPQCEERELDYSPAGKSWIVTCKCGYLRVDEMQCEICGGDYNKACNEQTNCLNMPTQ